MKTTGTINYIVSHPSRQLKKAWIDHIREYARIAEKEGRLQIAQLDLAYQEQWFKMLVPKQYGGLELSLPNEVRLIEALSYIDGSLGWAVTLCTGAGWFGGFLNAHLGREVFADPKVCLAGSGAHGGKALITADGYRVSGHWRYASGALHATHFTANCVICDENGPVSDNDGKEIVKAFLFKADEVKILSAWYYTGMVATGSHSFEVSNLLIPKNRAFVIDPDYLVVDQPLYHYPFLQLAEATLAVNLSGLAIHFIDLAQKAFAAKKVTKNLPDAHKAELDEVLQDAYTRLNDARISFYDDVDRSWLDYLQDDETDRDDNLANVSRSSRKLAKTSIQVVDLLYPYCGLQAASHTTELNQVWRDIHTASQHALLTFETRA